VDLILKAWTERMPFGFHGKHYQFPQVAIWPRPIQQPHPPLLMSATSPDSVRFAAEKKAIMAMNMFIFDLAVPKRMIRLYYDIAQQNGWTPTAENVLIGMHCCIADTDEEARHWLGRGQRYLSGTLLAASSQAHHVAQDGSTYHPDAQHREAVERKFAAPWPSIEQQIDAGTVICGTPETAIRQIEHAQRELGHGIFNLTMKVGNVPDDVVTHSMELFRDHVKPAVASLEAERLLRT
jgi:alkanesulfonate monooxygenase SsuD/methylene tetrahydromethanopterin reductase-like flavin-dependent oxidoreductase (luciferase family)